MSKLQYPAGLQESAPRFNAGIALQGRKIGGRYQGRILRCLRSSGAPAGRVVVMGRFPGLKRRAEPSPKKLNRCRLERCELEAHFFGSFAEIVQ